jgi:glycine cleavage system H protein
MYVPKNLYYTENHLWLRKIGLYDFCLGITDFAQKEIGEIHLIELNRQKITIKKDEPWGTVYGINETFALIAPCDCKIIEVNKNVMIKPAHINTDPYNCWLFILSASISTDDFLTYKDYIQITK